jgi:hypothetical protein
VRRVTVVARAHVVCAPVMYAVLIRFDASGECPVVVRDGDPLPDGPGVRFRFVAQAGDDAEACRIVLGLQPECLALRAAANRRLPSHGAS